MATPEANQPPSIEEQIDAVGFGRFQITALCAFVLFIVSDGMELVTTNVIWRAMPREEWGMGEDVRGLLVSLSYLGFVVGAIAGGFAGDAYGRKAILYAHMVMFSPIAAASAFSQNQYQLIASRFFVGVSMGLVLPTVVSLMTEFSTTETRARAVIAIPGLAFSVGQTLVLGAGLWLMTIYGLDCTDCSWWRLMLVAGIIPDLTASVLVILYIPESPRFLRYQNKREELEETIRYIAKMNDKEDKLLMGGQVQLLDKADIQGNDYATQLKELFQPPLQGLLILMISIWCLIGCSLFTQAFSYPVVLDTAYPDLTLYDQYWLLIQMAIAEFPGTILVFLIVDDPRFGRRPSIEIFVIASMLSTVFVLVIFDWGLMWFHVGNLMIRLCVTVPYQVMYVFCAEMLPTSHRNQGLSFGNGTTKLMAVLVPLIMFSAVSSNPRIPYYSVLLFSSFGLALVWLVAKDPPRILQDVIGTPRKPDENLGKSEQSPLLTEKEKIPT